MPATTSASFDFMGAFESLVAQAAHRRPGARRPSVSFPEIHEVCLDRFAVVEYAHLPGQRARSDRSLDSIEALSAAYGWSVDSIIRTLDNYVTA